MNNNANTVFSDFVSIARESCRLVYSCRELIKGGHAEAAEFLLDQVQKRLDLAESAMYSAENNGFSGNWVRLPKRLRGAVRRHLGDSNASADTVSRFVAQGLAALPDAKKAALPELLAMGFDMPVEAETSRNEWAKYLNTEQLIVAKIGKFAMAGQMLPTVLLKKPTIHNGEVIETDHIWLHLPQFEGFEQLRVGDMISFIGKISFYRDDDTKIGIDQVDGLKVLAQGSGKSFEDSAMGNIWGRVKGGKG